METQVITVSPDDPLPYVQRLFFEEEIAGAPVVDERGRVLGIISSMDLLRAATEQHEVERGEPIHLEAGLEFSLPAGMGEQLEARLPEISASEVMTPGAASVGPEAPVCEVARLMRSQRIHRVLVVEDDRLRGIISTFDMVALLEKEA